MAAPKSNRARGANRLVNRLGIAPIVERTPVPAPAEVARARKAAGLSQEEAALLVSPAKTKPYRTWQNYEIPAGQNGARPIPLASWELFLLLTGQHPSYALVEQPNKTPYTP